MNQQGGLNLADLFESVVGQLQQDREHLNELDRFGGNANHGDNMVNNFGLIAEALRGARGQDAGAQLRKAAETLERQGRGSSAGLYAEGLREAGQRLAGQQSIGMDDLVPLLQGLLGGVQRRTDAQPGQGTLLDSLLPGIMSFAQARGQGRSTAEAAMEALGAATRGSHQWQRQPAQYGNYRRQAQQPWLDPGASSATSVLEGLFRKVIGF